MALYMGAYSWRGEALRTCWDVIQNSKRMASYMGAYGRGEFNVAPPTYWNKVDGHYIWGLIAGEGTPDMLGCNPR